MRRYGGRGDTWIGLCLGRWWWMGSGAEGSRGDSGESE